MIIQKFQHYVIKTWHNSKWSIFSKGFFQGKEIEISSKKKLALPLVWLVSQSCFEKWNFLRIQGVFSFFVISLPFCQFYYAMKLWHNPKKYAKQAGAELGQAQLILGLGCTNMFNMKCLASYLVSFCSLRRPTWHFTPFRYAQLSISSCNWINHSWL